MSNRIFRTSFWWEGVIQGNGKFRILELYFMYSRRNLDYDSKNLLDEDALKTD